MCKYLINLSTVNFRTNLDLTSGKCLTKTNFAMKIKIGIFVISNVPNFNKF